MLDGYSPSIVVTLGDLLNLTDQKRTSPAVRGAGARRGPPPPRLRSVNASVPSAGLIPRRLPAVALSAQSPTVFRIVRIESSKFECPSVEWVVVRMDRRAAAPESAERVHREHSLAEPAAVAVPVPPTGRAAPASLGLPSTSVAPAGGGHQLGASGLATDSPRHQLPPVPRRHSCPVPPTGPVRGWSGQPVVRGRP